MTNKVRTALERVQVTMTKYAELRVQELQDERILMDELAETILRVDDLLTRLVSGRHSEAVVALKLIRTTKEKEHDTDIS